MLNGLPKDWKWVKLKDIAESIQYGFTESSSKERVGPKFLRITDIQENKVAWNDVPYCRIDEASKMKYLLQDGDLVFARTGATVGKSFLIKGEIPESVFASYLIRVRVNKEIDEKYLANFFQSTIYWSQITDGQVGIGQPNVNGTKLGQLSVPLAPKDEQQQIVSKIEELFSELDKGIEELKTAQQQLKVYRQAVLKWAFEGKLTNEDVKDGELPKEWSSTKLGDLLEVLTDYHANGSYEKLKEKVVLTDDVDYAVMIRATNFEKKDFKDNLKFISQEAYEFLSKSKLFGGEILIGKIGNAGRVYFMPDLKKPASLAMNLFALRVKSQYNSKYLYYHLLTTSTKKEIHSYVKGVGNPTIDKKAIRSINIATCPLSQQDAIVEEIESRLSVCDKIEETINDSLKQAEALRQSILKKAFEGKLCW